MRTKPGCGKPTRIYGTSCVQPVLAPTHRGEPATWQDERRPVPELPHGSSEKSLRRSPTQDSHKEIAGPLHARRSGSGDGSSEDSQSGTGEHPTPVPFWLDRFTASRSTEPRRRWDGWG